MHTSKLYYRVDRRRISLLKFTFEAYEGLAVVTTLDADRGWVMLSAAPGCEAMVRAIVADLSGSFLVEPWEGPWEPHAQPAASQPFEGRTGE